MGERNGQENGAGIVLATKRPSPKRYRTPLIHPKSVDVGTVKIDEPGDVTIHVERTRRDWKPVNLRSVTLVPQG